eukprot:scaffold4049_cov204-Alexandrium_tamarense.AAC.64
MSESPFAPPPQTTDRHRDEERKIHVPMQQMENQDSCESVDAAANLENVRSLMKDVEGHRGAPTSHSRSYSYF